MSYVTVSVSVDIDLDQIDTDDLIDELTYRGYTAVDNGEDAATEAWYKDQVFELYKEWLADEGDNDRRFDKAIRAFFSKMLDKNV